ncbi:HAMP domain-containing protein [candidate division KSB1 bacterium]|nr:HAMP domain-containing protein [candidate division KSB1 bacterium]
MSKLNWRKKLILFAVIVAIIPIAISGINMIGKTKDELKSSTNYELILTTGQLAQDVNNFYANRWLAPMLLMKSGLENEELGAEEKATFLSAGIKNIEDIIALALVFEIRPGEYVTAIETQKESFVSRLREASLDIKDSLSPLQEEIVTLVAQNLTIGTPRYLNSLDVWLVSMQLPVNISGAPPAVLFAQIDMNQMRERVKNQPLPRNGRIFVIDNNGKAVFDVEREDLTYLKVVQDATNMLRTGSRAQGVTNYNTPTGEKVVGCYAFPLNISWAIIAEINEEQAYIAVSKMLNSLSMWVLLGLGIAIIGVLIFSRQISKPILKMSKAAEEISLGQFDVNVEYKADDEIGVLGRSLENMSKSLKENFEKIENQNKELEEYSRNLEDKVSQRTTELKEKNITLEKTLITLKETQDQLIVHEKLASLGALTAGIAHEIKNPLNFVNNFASLSADLIDELEGELKENSPRIEKENIENIQDLLNNIKSNLTKISEHGKRADRIVHSMLQHSRRDSGEFQMTDLNNFIEDSLSFVYDSMRAKDAMFNLKIVREYDPSVGKVSMNPPSMSQVVLNIINNSIYATSEKKKKSNNDYVPTLTVSTQNLGEKIEIRLRDNGTGIPRKVVEKIFEPFFTTKPTGQGIGLGLSLSYDIVVRMHQGELKVDSLEDQFTEFIIRLNNK